MTLAESKSLALGGMARDVFVQAMLNPPPPNAAALSAVRYYREFMGS